MAGLVSKSTGSTVKASLTETAAQGQAKSFPAFTREPLLNEIPDQGFVLATVSGTVYIYGRVGIKRYKVAMTPV